MVIYRLFSGVTESYEYTIGRTPREALQRIRKHYGIERIDLFKIRKIPTAPGYPNSEYLRTTHYQVVLRTREAGCKRERVYIQSFMVLREVK